MWKRKWCAICYDGSYMARLCNICMLIIAVYLFTYILIYCIVQHWMTFFCPRESIISPFTEGFPRSKLRKGIHQPGGQQSDIKRFVIHNWGIMGYLPQRNIAKWSRWWSKKNMPGMNMFSAVQLLGGIGDQDHVSRIGRSKDCQLWTVRRSFEHNNYCKVY